MLATSASSLYELFDRAQFRSASDRIVSFHTHTTVSETEVSLMSVRITSRDVTT